MFSDRRDTFSILLFKSRLRCYIFQKSIHIFSSNKSSGKKVLNAKLKEVKDGKLQSFSFEDACLKMGPKKKIVQKMLSFKCCYWLYESLLHRCFLRYTEKNIIRSYIAFLNWWCFTNISKFFLYPFEVLLFNTVGCKCIAPVIIVIVIVTWTPQGQYQNPYLSKMFSSGFNKRLCESSLPHVLTSLGNVWTQYCFVLVNCV